MTLRNAAAVACLCLLAACGSNSPAPPAPSPPSGNNGESITGRERIGWDQAAASTDDLATFKYAIYVDGVRSQLADVNCSSNAGSNGFPCSARLPAMSNGTHELELASFTEDQGGVIESSRSSPLRVTVTGATAGTEPVALADGETITTLDGVRLKADVLLDGLDEPSALAIGPGGRGYLATASGILSLKNGAAAGQFQPTDGTVVALTISPAFERDQHIFVTQSVRRDDGSSGFRTSRYRDFNGRLAERMVVLENGPASAAPAAAARFGPDQKLYLAFDNGGNPSAAERMSEWSGKVLRMEPDGRTPDDQAAGSPVLFRGLTSPRGLDFNSDGSALWIADAAGGLERLRIVTSTSDRPRRAGQRGTYVMPRGLGAAALAFYRDGISAMTGDMLIAGRDGGYILRVKFNAEDRYQPAWSERLLEGKVRTVRALAIGADGAIYFCTDQALVRLSEQR